MKTGAKNERMEKAIHTLIWRAYSFTCGYKTAWDQWMMEEEKEGFTYEQVNHQLETRVIR